MKALFFITLLLLNILISAAQSDFKSKENAIDSLMTAHIVHKGKNPVHNFLLYAKNETTGFEIHKGIGTIGRNDIKIDEEYQYNIASITKTLVAAIILQLEEEGKLSTRDNADKYLGGVDFVKFDKIHIMDDTSYAHIITVEMLLHHTSGIADIFTDAATKFNISVLLHKKRQFTTEMIIDRFYKYKLNRKPFNKPGEGYHYSDINYMLLGFIIEQVTGQSLPAAIRERILVPLKLNDTWFEYYEPPAGSGKRIDAFLNGINMTKKINTSYEWGGGGLVSTTKDMGLFIKGLFDNKLFKNPSTLKKMTDYSVTKKFGENYGMGIYKYELNGRIFYGHGGFYGSILAYDPVEKITFSANIGQANPPYDAGKLVNELMDIIMTK
jgi:D-alanyl-D-alanine carboxypeptidase